MNKYIMGTLLVLVVVGWTTYVNTAVEKEILDNNIRVERTIKDAIKETKDTNPTSNPNISLDRLRDTLSTW